MMPELSNEDLAELHKFLIDLNDKHTITLSILKAMKVMLINQGVVTKEEFVEAMEDHAALLLRTSRISGFPEETVAGFERAAEGVREFANMEGEPFVKPVPE